MATTAVGIAAPVGIRNGATMLTNNARDLATITDLFDRIAVANGGSREIGGIWASDRAVLIDEVTAQITTFQTVNAMPAIDSAIDPGGQTLRLMNSLASEPPIQAIVADPPAGKEQDLLQRQPGFASFTSLPGSDKLEPVSQVVQFSRRLVRVEASSIKWFGVVVPNGVLNAAADATPHIFFTPTPQQGGYYDPGYDAFTSWAKLWDDYTDRIGALIAASGASQILVIPFYKNGQYGNLGSFLKNWQDVIAAVVTAAVNDISPSALSDDFAVTSIVTASFSNGVTVHRQFNTQGAGVAAATSVIFDLDGQAQTGGSDWRPAKGVIYLNRPAPRINPHGNEWYVGNRWGKFDTYYPETSRFSHHACSQFLLFHGLFLKCRDQ